MGFASFHEREARLEGQVESLQAENNDLREHAVVLERSTQVDRRAYAEMTRNLDALQDEIMELKEEVSFYRNIVSPVEGAQGLRIQSLTISPGAGPGIHRYRLVLTQVIQHSAPVDGEAQLRVEGFEGKTAKSLSLAELNGGAASVPFHFRYFQTLEGDLRLPDGFVPSRVVVEVRPADKNAKTVTETFPWPRDGGGHG